MIKANVIIPKRQSGFFHTGIMSVIIISTKFINPCNLFQQSNSVWEKFRMIYFANEDVILKNISKKSVSALTVKIHLTLIYRLHREIYYFPARLLQQLL